MIALRKSIAGAGRHLYKRAMFQPREIAALSLGLALAACGANDMRSYPALSPRPIEARFNAPPAAVPAAAPAAAAPADSAGLARLRAEIAASASAFDAALPAGTRAVNAADSAAPGSEPWVGAMQAIAQLDIIRARTGDAVGRLGEMGIELAEKGAAAGVPSSLQGDIDAALDQGGAEERRQSAAIAALSGRLRTD